MQGGPPDSNYRLLPAVTRLRRAANGECRQFPGFTVGNATYSSFVLSLSIASGAMPEASRYEAAPPQFVSR
jgi:hypothetical protein